MSLVEALSVQPIRVAPTAARFALIPKGKICSLLQALCYGGTTIQLALQTSSTRRKFQHLSQAMPHHSRTRLRAAIVFPHRSSWIVWDFTHQGERASVGGKSAPVGQLSQLPVPGPKRNRFPLLVLMLRTEIIWTALPTTIRRHWLGKHCPQMQLSRTRTQSRPQVGLAVRKL